jgi:hypothetical protein
MIYNSTQHSQIKLAGGQAKSSIVSYSHALPGLGFRF